MRRFTQSGKQPCSGKALPGFAWLHPFAALAMVVALLWPVSTLAIVNGKPVNDSRFAAQYPWAVVVVNKIGGGICGGVLIAPRWVLTAAHCTSTNRYVLLDNARRDRAEQVDVQRAIRHPAFSIDTLQNDVGLLYLAESRPGPYAKVVSPLQFRQILRPGAAATILGWGRTERSREPVARVHEAPVLLQELTLNGSRLGYRYRAGPCGRDSGSPMLMQTLDGQPVIVGVASATDGNLCSTGGGFAVYTSLASVYDFILAHVTSEDGP